MKRILLSGISTFVKRSAYSFYGIVVPVDWLLRPKVINFSVPHPEALVPTHQTQSSHGSPVCASVCVF